MKILPIILLLFSTACSQQAVYDNIQHHHRLECEQQPPAQYDDCIKEVSQSYKDYQREREQAKEQ
ncbi:hypothetical protein [Oceanicoccus sagamiensis]|uniref:Lipoprotein n=1 Tax=Oceanicoccus sagamiensis TaxID=716816 RepID=A0A1X9NFP0_9GAMM|nr:hypothetical protein [Oceanicoccus sagamiensis]ARN73767.1 hypothetical protein BST96_06350 [Oceanicoccus sagamiensis]